MKRRKTKGRGVKPNIIEVLHWVGRYYQYIAYYVFEYYEKPQLLSVLQKSISQCLQIRYDAQIQILIWTLKWGSAHRGYDSLFKI